MKNKWIKLAGAAVAALALTASVQATSIVGSIGYNGAYQQANGLHGQLNTSTAFNIISSFVTDGTGSGVFSGFTHLNSTLVFAPSVGNINNGGASLTSAPYLWMLSYLTTTYTFVVTSETEPLDTTTQVALTGNGTLTDNNGNGPITGVWTLGFNVSGDSFSFSGTSGTNTVPDGGATVMLLGIALSGLGLLKKKFTA
jgi:hypothetical protein